ncbi:MAG: pirin family protein [Acidimicrobiales bacterium]
MTDAVIRTFPLGAPPWPTLDPFLFCVHHRDDYPVANAEMGPAVSLAGRAIGQDFSGRDGWSMYHGSTVPGFPQHPHRGFETVTWARSGLIDHSDSLGATARFGRGDTQWMTAGGGIVHAEMFPLLDREGPNPVELFQIWLNLPADDKMVDPYFTMLWAEDIPSSSYTDEAGRSTEVTVMAGELDGLRPPPPPPDSWAGRADTDVTIWHIVLDAGATWSLPTTAPTTTRVLYLFGGGALDVDGVECETSRGVVVRGDAAVPLRAGGERVECLLLGGRPIDEPVAQYGPFVLNDEAGIRQAMLDYQQTGFGGWPWPRPDPVHDRTQGRFARHADGTVESR